MGGAHSFEVEVEALHTWATAGADAGQKEDGATVVGAAPLPRGELGAEYCNTPPACDRSCDMWNVFY